MRVNGRAFDGSTRFLDTDRRWRLIAGNIMWFTEFRPVQFPAKETIYLLLLELFRHDICCHLTGSFVSFTAGVFNSFKAATLYIAMTDTPLLNLIFQKGPVPIQNFSINAFEFFLLALQPRNNIYAYHVTKGDFCMLFFIFGIDTSSHCGPCSNVDFVHFLWQNLERFSFRKYAMTLLPSEDTSEPRLLCLKYYRAESDGWKDSANCHSCVLEYRETLRPISDCCQSAICCCTICRKQPPSLLALAANVVFKDVFNLECFELTADTTYRQYVYAVNSKRVSFWNLLPPEYPYIRVWFHFHCFPHNLHCDCPGRGLWYGHLSYAFKSNIEAISALMNQKEQFWCQHCDKPLFFPKSCPVHPED